LELLLDEPAKRAAAAVAGAPRVVAAVAAEVDAEVRTHYIHNIKPSAIRLFCVDSQ